MDKKETSTRKYQQMLEATRKFSENKLTVEYYLSSIDGILETTHEEDEEWSAAVRKSWDVIEVAHAYQLDEGSKHMRADHTALVRKAIDDLEMLFLNKTAHIHQ